jgi:hypothetical protein
MQDSENAQTPTRCNVDVMDPSHAERHAEENTMESMSKETKGTKGMKRDSPAILCHRAVE